MNATERGIEWERAGSFEILFPDGTQGLQVNTGIRIRGGFSRDGSNPKHAFRLFFRGDYGAGKLRYPLFGTEGAEEFDKLDLRTSQNYSWSFQGNLAQNTMNRDVFSRDLQRELGRPYTRSRYYHLYIDGVYWGLYQSQERAEANFAETYFGGTEDDYDVVKVATEQDYAVEATDGTLDSWQRVWELCQTGFADNAAFYQLQGLDAAGVRDPTLEVLVDIDNLIDYMLVIFYTGNFDAPVSKWFQNQNPNNFYAIKSIVDSNLGFRFFAHDSEHTLHAEAVGPTIGVEENRVNIGDAAMDESGNESREFLMAVTEFSKFHPQWLHHRLTENAEYRARFGARAQQLLAGTGPMTTAAASQLFQARADEIDMAIIAESARWGDAHPSRTDNPRTKLDDWAPAVQLVINGFFGPRTQIVISQLQAAGLYPN